jgi:23S rRNA pseudouridine1911/1915/1917 synthase
MNSYLIHIEDKDAGQRIDKILPEKLVDISRSRLQSLIEQGFVTCGDAQIKSGKAKTVEGQEYKVVLPEALDAAPIAQDIPLDIVYEDDDLLVINKQIGLVVHPGAGNVDGTLVNALLHHCGDSLSGIGGVKRPGIVHRLDKDTSGLMLVAKNDAAHLALSEELQERDIKRVYHAFCWGLPLPESGKVDLPIGRDSRDRIKMAIKRSGGRYAVTHYKTLRFFGDDDNGVSLIECKLETGRTHQIRVHMQSLGVNLVGDNLYGAPPSRIKAMIKKGYLAEDNPEFYSFMTDYPYQALHAKAISFTHPRTQERMSFEVPYPKDIERLFQGLNAAVS